MGKTKRSHLFLSKLMYTLMIIAFYAVIRDINLYGIDYAKMANLDVNADMLIGQVIGGDLYKCSIMAIGLGPFMIASIIVQFRVALLSKEAKQTLSPKKMNRQIMFMTVSLALIMAIIRQNDLVFIYSGVMEIVARCVAVLEMVTGSILIIWISRRNKLYGIGGQMAPIVVNVLDGIVASTKGSDIDVLIMPTIIGLAMMFVMLFLENTEKRIPVQRISIINIYADRNYQAIKFIPVGIMPVLFASAAFMLPQVIIRTLALNFPNNEEIMWANDNMLLSKPLGICTYIIIIYLLNLLFTVVMISPKEMAENFQKSGDSIVNLHPGKETRRYLRTNIFWAWFFSSTIMSLFMGGSMYLQMIGVIPGSLAMLPSSLMLLSGLWSTLYREAIAIVHTDSYKAFI